MCEKREKAFSIGIFAYGAFFIGRYQEMTSCQYNMVTEALFFSIVGFKIKISHLCFMIG